MSLFGKLLAVLNLVALCAFLYLAVVDFQVRQAWSYAVFRWDLALDGLPVDEEETDGRNRLRHLNLHPELCVELVGSSDTRTLEGFLEQRKKELLARVNDANIKLPRTQKLIDILMRLADTAGEREALQALMTDRSPNLEEKLLSQLDERINTLKRPVPGTDKKDRDGKKSAIARALVNLLDAVPTEEEKKTYDAERRAALQKRPLEQRADPSNDKTYKQTLHALGLRLMVRTLDQLAEETLTIGNSVLAARKQERMLFAYQHQQIVNQLFEREHQLQEQKDLLEIKKRQAREQKALADAQEEKVRDRTEELRKERDKTAAELVKLEAEQDRLFRLRLRLRDANRINQEMEEQIRKLESEKP